MRTVLHKEFKKHRQKLQKQGGVADKVYLQVAAAIDNWNHGQTPNLQRTRHGESRLNHCIKYQLSRAFRLVTIEHQNIRTLVAVGDHDFIDAWLESHKGHDLVVDKKTGGVDFLEAEPFDISNAEDQERADYAFGPLTDHLKEESIERLLLPDRVARFLKTLTLEKLEEQDTWYFLDALAFSTPEQKDTVLKALDYLIKGLPEKAEAQIKLFAKEAVFAADDPDALEDAIVSGKASSEMVDITGYNENQLRELFQKLSYSDWLLYLNPSQEKLVKASHNGPARVVGVSGSGKTCVLVHRARELARKYPGEKILILVLNESLKYLIENLITQLCNEDEAKSIRVMRIYEYCYTASKTIEPAQLIEPEDPRSRETLESCWSDFTSNANRDKELRRLISTLVTPLRLRDVDEWSYLHDELIWIRTGFSTQQRRDYLSCERTGRGINFPIYDPSNIQYGENQATGTGFPADTRMRILKILERYEEYMAAGGLLDEDGVALKACEVSDRIPEHERLTARAVLVDEVQDCSTTQLSVISKIPTAPEDGLYLVGDPVQKVFPKQQNLKAAGIDIRGRSTILRVNYRNTRPILEASYQIIDSFRGKCPIPEGDILNPEYAVRRGPRPKLVLCSKPGQQAACLKDQIGLVRDTNSGTVCCATLTKDRLTNIEKELANDDWKFRHLTTKSKLDDIENSIMLSHFDEMKGHEFGHVFLLDLGQKQLQLRSIPKEERWRTAFQLYVAMTRAQDELWLFSTSEPSEIIKPIEPYVDIIKAEELLSY